MHLLGISSYPVPWRRLLWSAGLLILITALEGFGTLLWFLMNPSELASRAFLFYSFEKWMLILGTVVIILVVLSLLWAIRFRTSFVENLIRFFERSNLAHNLVFSVTLLFIIAAGLLIWLLREAAQTYVAQIYPLLLWGFAALAQTWIFLLVVHWQTVVKTFQAGFPVSTETQVYPLTMEDKYLLLALIGLSLVYLLLLGKSYFDVREALLIGDSWSYLQGASLDLTDPAFFSERRPWAILLIIKILGSSQVAIELFQLSLSALAWLWLAWTFVRSLQNGWTKLVGFSLTLGLSLTPSVQIWNHTVLSESLSISLMVLILCVFVSLSQQWKWRYLLWLVLFFLIWMSVREANAYVALFVAISLLLVGWIQRRLRAHWLLSFSIALIFFFNHQLSSAYALPRWALPLAEVITHRILPEREYLQYFQQNGMPVNSELLALSGRNAISDNYAVINNTKLKKFTRWLFNDSRNVYVRFLMTHPAYTIWSPLADIQVLLGYDYVVGIPVPAYVPALPAQVNELFYPLSWFWVYLGLSLASLGFIFATSLRTNRGVFWVIAVFFLLSIPHLYLVWHGDALDVERHAVIANVQFHLSVWLLLVLALDKVIPNRRLVDKMV
jgi:hypothetical protein